MIWIELLELKNPFERYDFICEFYCVGMLFGLMSQVRYMYCDRVSIINTKEMHATKILDES